MGSYQKRGGLKNSAEKPLIIKALVWIVFTSKGLRN